MAEPILLAKQRRHRMLPAAGDGQPPRPDHRRHRHRQDVTLQTLAENFSRLGVPVFMADVKGDLTGITQPGTSARSWPRC